MAKAETYTVMREHEGDRYYKAGEARELDPTAAKHLVDLGVLRAGAPDQGVAETAKSDPPVETKVEEPVANKVEAPAKDKATPGKAD